MDDTNMQRVVKVVYGVYVYRVVVKQGNVKEIVIHVKSEIWILQHWPVHNRWKYQQTSLQSFYLN